MNILEFIEKADEEKIIIFQAQLSGKCTSPTEKHLATISIALPRSVISKNIGEIDNWLLYTIAIPKEEYNKVLENHGVDNEK